MRSIADKMWAGMLCLAFLTPVAGAPANTPAALVDGFVRAWNGHDMAALAALFTPDADFVNVGARRLKGRAAIQAHHEESHRKKFRASTLRTTELGVREPRAGVAVIHFSWELTGALDPDGKPVAPRTGTMQLIALQEPEGWTVVAAQNTNAAAPR